MLGITVAERLRRNRKITITTRPTVSINENSTSLTEARMVVVRSVSTWILMDCGMDAFNCGNSRVMLSTTLMMFAPGCRWMFTITDGVWFIHAAWRTFS